MRSSTSCSIPSPSWSAWATASTWGGTLLNDLTGVPTDYDYVVARYNALTGAPRLRSGSSTPSTLATDYMKALAATPASVYAVGTHDPYGTPQMELVAWNNDGTARPPFPVLAPTPSRGNDVEARSVGGRRHSDVYVGGYGFAGSQNGATWHYRHFNVNGAPVTLLPQWSGGSGGANPKPYGSFVTDEVFDIWPGEEGPHRPRRVSRRGSCASARATGARTCSASSPPG